MFSYYVGFVFFFDESFKVGIIWGSSPSLSELSSSILVSFGFYFSYFTCSSELSEESELTAAAFFFNIANFLASFSFLFLSFLESFLDFFSFFLSLGVDASESSSTIFLCFFFFY